MVQLATCGFREAWWVSRATNSTLMPDRRSQRVGLVLPPRSRTRPITDQRLTHAGLPVHGIRIITCGGVLSALPLALPASLAACVARAISAIS